MIMCFTTKKDPPKREYVFCGEILEEVNSHPYLGVGLSKVSERNCVHGICETKAAVCLWCMGPAFPER